MGKVIRRILAIVPENNVHKCSHMILRSMHFAGSLMGYCGYLHRCVKETFEW